MIMSQSLAEHPPFANLNKNYIIPNRYPIFFESTPAGKIPISQFFIYALKSLYIYMHKAS